MNSKNNTITPKRPKIAICYDFDKTLSPDDMQTFTLIPSFGIDKETFWGEANTLAKDNLMDNNLSWMLKLIHYSALRRLPIKKDYFREIGKDVPLYKGVVSWFDRINQYADQKGIDVEHYIISSGLKEIIEGSKIANSFKRIYASSFLYSADGVAEWPAQAINYTNKTQFIFRIAKGYLEEWDERVNDSMEDSKLRIPYENIIYIGDSATDIPCMRLVKNKGGYSIGVFDPEKNNRKKVYQLFNDGRINYYAPANYTARSKMTTYVKQIIDEISAREIIKAEKERLQEPADMFKMYNDLKTIFEGTDRTKSQKRKTEEMLENIKSLIEGNID